MQRKYPLHQRRRIPRYEFESLHRNCCTSTTLPSKVNKFFLKRKRSLLLQHVSTWLLRRKVLLPFEWEQMAAGLTLLGYVRKWVWKKSNALLYSMPIFFFAENAPTMQKHENISLCPSNFKNLFFQAYCTFKICYPLLIFAC